jgi:hypothetical protein
MKRIIQIASLAVAITVALAGALLGVWWALIPGPDNQHCPRYVLWKYGIYPLDTNVVYECLILDTNRNSLVVGLTESQLQRRFKHLRTRETADDRQRFYNPDLPPDVRWLSDSSWVVLFTNGVASELRLIKP